MNDSLLFKDKPIFGLDIGFSNLKVMQLDSHGKRHTVTGYGLIDFDPEIIKDGVIVDPEALAKVIHKLFAQDIVGAITSRRVILSIPAVQTFNRTMQIPKLSQKELDEAIKLEAQQYIPMPLEELYIDYEIVRQNTDGLTLLISAAPRKIIDSYITFCQLAGLEIAAIETTISACNRIFMKTSVVDVPTILIDFGARSSEITVYDKKNMVVTSTAPGGGNNIAEILARQLEVTPKESHIIMKKYGLGVSKKQKQIIGSLSPLLESLIKEIRRMVRYYEERSGSNLKINQIITMGGGANMPGLAEYMTDRLRLPVRTFHPWDEFDFSLLTAPNEQERSAYATVAGLALIKHKDIFS
jgi:type IV pilus assembly protein PilM